MTESQLGSDVPEAGVAPLSEGDAIHAAPVGGPAVGTRTRGRSRGFRLGFPAVAAVGVIVAFLGDPYTLQLLGNALALGIWVMGLDYLVGYTGCVSFGHAAWLAVGAYASGYLFLQGWDVITAGLAMIAIVAVLAAFMGAVATRVGGLAFSIVTLAEGVVIYTVIFNLELIGGGVGLFGLPLPKIAGMELLSAEMSLYLFALVLALLSYLGLRWLVRSPLGGFCQAVRDDETRARSIGVEVQRHQILAFIAAAVVGGIGGMAFVVLNGGVDPTQATWSQSGLALVMLIIGGVGTLYGGMIGALIYVLGQQYLISNFGNTWQVYLGLLFVILVLLPPGGIAGGLRVGFRKLFSGAQRRKREPERSAA